MWADYYYNQNELVKLKFNNGIENKEDFDDFLNKWKQLYEEKKHFTFIFNTLNTSLVNPYYCYLMANFISELKKNKIQYLNYSVIIVKNKAIKILLNIIFNRILTAAFFTIITLKFKYWISFFFKSLIKLAIK